MPYKDPEKRKAYYRERYRKKKQEEKESLFKDKLRYMELAQKSHLGELDPRERGELDRLSEKLSREDVKYLEEHEPTISEIMGRETVTLSLDDPESIPDLSPHLGHGFDSEGDPIPLSYRGLPDSTILRLKRGKLTPAEIGRGGVEVDLNGNIIKKSKKRKENVGG